MAKKDYEKLNKEDLIKIVEKLETRKKYGLIWDEERVKEKFEKDSENALPVLKEIKSKEIKTDEKSPNNILIEGDNYHSLSVLNFTHQNKIDVIYIDPPYNTGNKDFKYNDNYVDKEDSYRHSKWLSFMSKRLRLAKKLLKETGTIFISIDDNEQAPLKMLCDEIFDEKKFIANIVVQSNPRGKQQMDIAVTHEYLLVYAKDVEKLNFKHQQLTEKQISEYNKEDAVGNYREIGLRKRGAASRRVDVPNLYYPIYIDPKTGRVSLEKTKKFLEKALPILSTGEDGRWRWGRKKFEAKKDLLFARIVNGDRWDVFERDYLKDDKTTKLKSVWLDKELNYENAKAELKNIFNGISPFDYPKTTYLIKKILTTAPDDSVILDFMAGSGTTGQAVLAANSIDDGNRRFILCTNNENNICAQVCYPRLKKVIKGYGTKKGEKIEKLGGNLKYYKTAFVKNTISRDELKTKITQECTEMLCLRENIFEEVKKTKAYRIYKQNDRVLVVYYDLERNKLDTLKNNLDKIKGDKVLYCFTLDSLGLDKKDFIKWDDVRLEPIPQKILDVYKNIYEY
ncbi:site-specific DNA-methyltransferase [Candidatus Parcubacteria bacterium]|nr:MAG: site-specific DNA-methyltransferase [Candidatus Parcubacteria bacterium]